MANIYVRKSGSDSNDGSTPALAKLTIASAISAMTSGDTIYVGSGVYREQSLTTGSKNVTIIGDTTGEYTGDAGEVIWSGLNATDDEYTYCSYGIYRNSNYTFNIENIVFQNWYSENVIKIENVSNFSIKNCKGLNIFNTNGLCYFISVNIPNQSTSNKNYLIEDIYIDGITSFRNTSSESCVSSGIYINSQGQDFSVNAICRNVVVRNVCAIGGYYSYAYGISHSNFQSLRFKFYNITVENIIARGYPISQAIGLNGDSRYGTAAYNISVSNVFAFFSGDESNTKAYGITVDFYSEYPLKLYNSSAVNVKAVGGGTASNFRNTKNTDCITKANYTIQKIPQISKYSPLREQGSTTFSSEDIEGNPRPAYGNGTACDIGASESTSDTIQREATIKDSGDYSIKVSPCNYFKKVFQVPVEASTLRTVKVKIRIDGTWGTYLPRVSLSGQGMTLSQDTKNSTTGSFEELTVSGTPTTTGIALLTIEAHSPNTDAVFYIDTITVE